MPKISENLESTLFRAMALAKGHDHLTVGTEHLLFSLINDADAKLSFLAFGVDTLDLTRKLMVDLNNYPVHAVADPTEDAQTTPLSMDIQRAIGVATKNAIVRGQQQVDGVNLLFGILAEKSDASDLLKSYKMSSYELFHWMQYGTLEKRKSGEQTAFDPLQLPHQIDAPIRISLDQGRFVKSSDRGSPIDADESDFDRWRAPVSSRLRELLDDDLRPGTNHSRLRKRLLDLAAALAGTIDDVKENQFRLGYAIEALGLLVDVYRTAADDMPALNAAVFVDVDHLHIQLMLGQSKLVAWRRFQHDADADELQEGAADAEAVRAALDQGADVLESDAAKPVVDPELPRSIRWLRDAIADPAVTTKRMVYGAVKSLENVVSFLGQIALRPAKAVGKDLGGAISKAVASRLLVALGGAALSLSAALPTQWSWLKPLLEAAAKLLHG